MAKDNKGKWFNNIARLIKRKDGGYFLKFERASKKNEAGEYVPTGDNPYPLTINEGDIFQARLKRDDLAKLVENGKMSKETADSICESVKFEFSIAPKEGSAAKVDKDEVDF